MRFCKKCNNQIPARVWVEGKQRNICKRSYCLECSPFGTHNTKQIHLEVGVSGDRECVCTVCKKPYIYSRRKSNSTVRCNSCYVKSRRKNMKEASIRKKGGKCVCCGYNRCHASLDFHHIDPTTKEFGIAGNNFSKKRIEVEIEKCVLVCRNCHGEIEAGLRTFSGGGSSIGLEQRTVAP